MTEKVLEKYLAPALFSNAGRIGTLVIYAILIAGSIYGCLLVRIDFKVDYFIGKTAPVYEYFQLNDKYFKSGSFTTFYVDNSSLDFSSAEVQQQLTKFNEALNTCPDCQEKWFIPGTLNSWYAKFN